MKKVFISIIYLKCCYIYVNTLLQRLFQTFDVLNVLDDPLHFRVKTHKGI